MQALLLSKFKLQKKIFMYFLKSSLFSVIKIIKKIEFSYSWVNYLIITEIIKIYVKNTSISHDFFYFIFKTTTIYIGSLVVPFIKLQIKINKLKINPIYTITKKF